MQKKVSISQSSKKVFSQAGVALRKLSPGKVSISQSSKKVFSQAGVALRKLSPGKVSISQSSKKVFSPIQRGERPLLFQVSISQSSKKVFSRNYAALPYSLPFIVSISQSSKKVFSQGQHPDGYWEEDWFQSLNRAKRYLACHPHSVAWEAVLCNGFREAAKPTGCATRLRFVAKSRNFIQIQPMHFSQAMQ